MCSSASNATRGHSKSENTSENNQNDSVLNHDKELASLGLSPIDKKKLLKKSMELNENQKGADQVIANDSLIIANKLNISSVNYLLLN